MVATDAIGLGLNLPIERVIFTSLDKYDGISRRMLTYSEIKQIAGRAGRFGIKQRGLAGVLAPLNSNLIASALNSPPSSTTDHRLMVMPPWSAVELVSKSFNTQNLAAILGYISKELIARSPHLRPASLEVANQICGMISSSSLSLREQFSYLGTPINLNNSDFYSVFTRWSKMHGAGQIIEAPFCPYRSVPSTPEQMADCEDVLNRLTVYSWLSMRWPDTYPQKEAAIDARLEVNSLIEQALARETLRRKTNPSIWHLQSRVAVSLKQH